MSPRDVDASGVQIYEVGPRDGLQNEPGLGGCPDAPGASGNVATEDLVDLFESQRVATGIDLDALVDASAWLERDVLARTLAGRVYRARLGARERAGDSVAVEGEA